MQCCSCTLNACLGADFEPLATGMLLEPFLETLGLNDVSQPVAWLVLIAIMLLLRGLALLALTLRLWRRMA